MDERKTRIGRNEALFREVNERLEGLNDALARLSERVEFVCECGDAGCVDRITMKVDAYEALRADPTTFAVITGHVANDVETVVAEDEAGYSVVRKHPGEPAKLAAREDPRSG